MCHIKAFEMFIAAIQFSSTKTQNAEEKHKYCYNKINHNTRYRFVTAITHIIGIFSIINMIDNKPFVMFKRLPNHIMSYYDVETFRVRLNDNSPTY